MTHKSDWATGVAEKIDSTHQTKEVMIGFDGFIDEIIHVVDERTDKDTFTSIPTIAHLAERISAVAGLSGAFELVNKQTKLGGNGPILANAMIEQGNKVTYVGTIGAEGIHPVFAEFAGNCEHVISVCEPAHTDALEFEDGKVMLSKISELDALDWNLLNALTEEGELKGITARSSLLAFTNWTAIQGMNGIIEGFTQLLRETGTNPYVFLDLADPSKRAEADLRELFSLMKEMGKYSRVIFGMNEHEADILAPYLGIHEEGLKERATLMRKALEIAIAVIHPVRGAAAASEEGSWWVDGPYTAKPVLTTGAGDNFNAGFCNGILQGLNLQESLLTGVSTSGYYVRQGHSPSTSQLTTFIRSWTSGRM